MRTLDTDLEAHVIASSSPRGWIDRHLARLGIAAARAAGIFCVAVPNSLTARLVLDGADLRIDTLLDLPLARLLSNI